MPNLTTFLLPPSVTGTPSDIRLGRDMIDAWREGWILQLAVDPVQAQKAVTAMTAGRRFFSMPLEYKERHVSALSYSGYSRGEEEVFTVCKDVPEGDIRVREGWPCHGPVPWPDLEYRLAMRAFMDEAGAVGERLLRLIALGLGLPSIDALTRLTIDGWHHMFMLRRPLTANTPRGRTAPGLLGIVAQDARGRLFVRPEGAPWTLVRPEPNALSVFPGDLMSFLTDGLLPSTPHKVEPTESEHLTLAYFHEPSFEAELRPLGGGDPIHYGTYVTTTFMRCYPKREATRRLRRDGRLEVLERLRAAASLL
jgi:2-oxoglutarate dioxygenase / 2-oxoglutarate/L-arginine monooxygenase/decarboxylase